MERSLQHIAARLDWGLVAGLPTGALPPFWDVVTATRSFCDLYLLQDSEGTAYPLSSEIKDALRQQRRLVLATWSTVDGEEKIAEASNRLVAALTEVVEHEFYMDGGQSLSRLQDAVTKVRDLCEAVLRLRP